MDGQRDKPRVVIVGGGVAGMEAALAIHHLAPGLAEVSLIAPEPDTGVPRPAGYELAAADL
jgi:NADH dehydrogenase FAD-containing subunit